MNRDHLIYPMTRILLSGIVVMIMFFGSGWRSLAWGQSATTGSITGVIRDEQNSVLGGAVITAQNMATNFAREVASNEGGGFSILELPPGIYKVTVTAEGFSKETAQFELGLGTTTKINFILRVSSTPNEVIEVTASDAFVPGEGKTESATNIDSGRIENLPINQRNFLDFTLT